jgi:leucyl/phenylalanyl-tRNA--protein transferase
VKGRRSQPVFLRPDVVEPFPDPHGFDAEGLVAIGGDLGCERLVAAYRSGVFPWYGEGYVPMWWSPDPRGVLTPASLHVARSLRKVLRRGRYQLTWNRCFARVMTECGRGRREGTWVIPEMVAAYTALHAAGCAHSLEVWHGAELVGGVYGVQVGALFAAESMFHRRTDMSKVAVVALVHTLGAAGVERIDVQFVTAHLATLGAFTMPRRDYLRWLATARDRAVDLASLQPTLGPAIA